MLLNIHESDIPEDFFDGDKNAPFTECQICSESLENKNYFVEKVYKRYPNETEHTILLEYAICKTCAEKKNAELSEESKNNLVDYMNDRLLGRMEEGVEETERNNNCMVTGKPLHHCDEYVSYGEFYGNKMRVGMFPYSLSADVLEEIANLLSDKTLEELDDFVGEHFTGPPEFKELLKDKKWVVL